MKNKLFLFLYLDIEPATMSVNNKGRQNSIIFFLNILYAQILEFLPIMHCSKFNKTELIYFQNCNPTNKRLRMFTPIIMTELWGNYLIVE